MRTLEWLSLAVAAISMVLLTSCGGDNSAELEEIRADLESLQLQIDSLQGELRALAEGPAADEELSAIATATAQLQDDIAASSGDIEEQREWLEQLAAEVAALSESRSEEASLTTADSGGETASCSATEGSAFTLQLLHAADMDGAAGALDNVETFSAILDGFRRQFPDNTLVVSSGDNFVPGPRFYAAADSANDPSLGISGDGRGDIVLLNAMGFQASALGNHELDRGTGAFASIIGSETVDGRTYVGAKFPYLASNLGFSEDANLRRAIVPDGQEASVAAGGIAGSAVITLCDERIGIVGATTPHLARLTGIGGITVAPPDADDIDALADIIQQSVDDLSDMGINKVILLAHMQQIAIEQALAVRLEDVDIIVAGGSNTLLADENDRLRVGDEAAGAYPLRFQSPDGAPVLVVNTDGDYRYLGRLLVGFDDRGVVIPGSLDSLASGAYATDNRGGQGIVGPPIPDVSRIVASLRGVLRSRGGNVVGRTSVYLAGRRRDSRTQETNLGNLTADANLWLARQVDPDVAVSLKNGGGIRDHIGVVLHPPGTTLPSDVVYAPPHANADAGTRDGDVSQLEIEGALRFNNGLVIVPVTAQQLKEIVEHGIGFDGVGDLEVGRFPQVGGMRFSFDPSAPTGQRVRSLAIVDDGGRVTDRVVAAGELVGDPDRGIKIVTLNFLANGGDGYPFPLPASGRIDLAGEAGQVNAPTPDFPDTNGNEVIDVPISPDPGLADFAAPGTEQDALSEYLARFFSGTPYDKAETPPAEDTRIQNLGIPGKQDTVFEAGE